MRNLDLYGEILQKRLIHFSPSLEHYSTELVGSNQIAKPHNEDKGFYGGNNQGTLLRISADAQGDDLDKISKEKIFWNGRNILCESLLAINIQ